MTKCSKSCAAILSGIVVGLVVTYFSIPLGWALAALKAIWSVVVWCPKTPFLVTSVLALWAALKLLALLHDVTLHDYTEDVIEGVHWRWQYGCSNAIVGLLACCPKCLCELVTLPQHNAILLYCEQCKAPVVKTQGDMYDMREKVERLIRCNRRTGNWRDRVELMKANDTRRQDSKTDR